MEKAGAGQAAEAAQHRPPLSAEPQRRVLEPLGLTGIERTAST